MWLTQKQVATLAKLGKDAQQGVVVYPKHNGKRQQGETRNVFTSIRFVNARYGMTGTIDTDGNFTETLTKKESAKK